MEYTDQQRAAAVKSRLVNIMESPKPDYRPTRHIGRISMSINGVETEIELIPVGNITQWDVKINGKLWRRSVGMNQVYKEMARRNPPAKHFC